MKALRSLIVIGSMLVLSASALSAQAMKVTCADGAKSAGGQGACSSHGGIATKAEVKADAKAGTMSLKADAKTANMALKGDAKAAKATQKSADQDAKGATARC